jgi:hypothetical protein
VLRREIANQDNDKRLLKVLEFIDKEDFKSALDMVIKYRWEGGNLAVSRKLAHYLVNVLAYKSPLPNNILVERLRMLIEFDLERMQNLSTLQANGWRESDLLAINMLEAKELVEDSEAEDCIIKSWWQLVLARGLMYNY